MFLEIYVFCVIAFSNFLQATTGFGYAIATTPLLAMALPPKESVMLTMTTGLIGRMAMLRVINGGSYSDVKPLLMTSVVGAFIGAYALTVVNSYWLKLFIAFVLLITGWAMWKERRVEITNQRLAERVVGALAGFLGSTTSINGPPIIMYYLNAGLDKNKDLFRANLTRYFLAMNILTVCLAIIFGSLEMSSIWRMTLIAVPALWLGLYLGEKFFHRIDAASFKRLTLLMVIISALLIIFNTLYN